MERVSQEGLLDRRPSWEAEGMDAEIIKGVKEKEKVISFSLPFDDLNVHESSLDP